MRVLVAGCGWLGTAIAEVLVAEGDRVVAVRRAWRDAAPGGAGVDAIELDLAAGPLALPRDVDAIVYAAAPDERSEGAYRRTYVVGLRNVLEALPDVQRVVLTSSTAVYAEESGGEVDEGSPVVADGTGAILVEGERLLASRSEGIALRLAGLYGPGRDRMVRTVRDGTARRPHRASTTNRIHRDDAARAVVHLLRLRAPDRVYVGVDDEPSDLGEVYTWLAGQLGVPVPLVGEGDSRARGGSKRCTNGRLRASGWSPRYPSYREGYRELLRR
jgi:nucleoside-diphosphate-sugar epimerase